jgi:hypothetical protein
MDFTVTAAQRDQRDFIDAEIARQERVIQTFRERVSSHQFSLPALFADDASIIAALAADYLIRSLAEIRFMDVTHNPDQARARLQGRRDAYLTMLAMERGGERTLNDQAKRRARQRLVEETLPWLIARVSPDRVAAA